MKTAWVGILRSLFPFVTTLVLWRLSAPFWNPGGVLALIPIFYCTFVRPVRWFMPFGMLVCFLIDYKSNTVLYWTAMYCALYAAYGFQNYIDLTRWDGGALRAFVATFGGAMLVLFFMRMDMPNLARTVWLVFWAAALYTPITAIIQRVHHD